MDETCGGNRNLPTSLSDVVRLPAHPKFAMGQSFIMTLYILVPDVIYSAS
jgi:hypothetical protein